MRHVEVRHGEAGKVGCGAFRLGMLRYGLARQVWQGEVSYGQDGSVEVSFGRLGEAG